MSKEFVTKQEQKNETEGSSLNSIDCEISSDESSKRETPYKKAKLIPIKRKKSLSNESSDDILLKKSKKTVFMESFNLTPCVVLEKLSNVNKETVNINHESDGDNSKQVTNKIVKKVKNNIMSNSYENLENNLVEESSLIDSDNDSKLITDDGNVCIDKNMIVTTPQEVSTLQSENNCLDSSTIIIDCDDNEPIVTEPDVIIYEDPTPTNDIIEINDSDEKMTENNLIKVPMQNKQCLESIINSSMFKSHMICI